jgi:RNA polymerase sigma-70 factor (ECF subfamily)
MQVLQLFRPVRAQTRPASPIAMREDRLRAIVSEHFDGAWLFMRRLGVAESDLEDAMQEATTIVAERLDDILPGREKSFLFGTAFRVASEHRRRRTRRREIDDDALEHVATDAHGPEQISDAARARVLLDAFLDEMPIELRAVFVMAEIDERSQAEIAELLGIPTGTVASRLRRGRADFEARVARWQARTGEGR